MTKKISISLLDQQLKAFEGDKQIYSFYCVSGDSKHLTKAGKYKILRKERRYRSKEYNSQMNFAMFINNSGVAIHESYYFEEDPDCHGFFSCFRAGSLGVVSDTLATGISLGRNIYPKIEEKNISSGNINLLGSHGCIRLSHNNAVKLFDWAEINVEVEIK